MDIFAFAQLFVEEFFPLHFTSVLDGKVREVVVEQFRQGIAVWQAEILPEMVVAHAGGGDQVRNATMVFVVHGAMIKQ